MASEVVPATELRKGDVIRFPVARGTATARIQKAEPCDLAEIGGYGAGVVLDLEFKARILISTRRICPQSLSSEWVGTSSCFERRVN